MFLTLGTDFDVEVAKCAHISLLGTDSCFLARIGTDSRPSGCDPIVLFERREKERQQGKRKPGTLAGLPRTIEWPEFI